MILEQAALIPPALNGVNAIFQVAVIRAGVKGAGGIKANKVFGLNKGGERICGMSVPNR